LLDEAPFPFFYAWNFLNNSMFDLTTSSMEAFFPMLTSQYGDNIPIDLLFEFPRVWDFKSSREKRRLSFNLDFRAKAYLHLPDNGGKQYIGMLEWYDGEAWIEIVSEGMLLKGNITKFAFQRAFCQTEYGISRYETSPFLMNMAFYGGVVVLNDSYLA
jgi:hypothetical protein